MGKCAIIGGECPRTNNPAMPRYCPAWSDGIVWTDTRTGQEVIKNCGLEMLIPAMIEVIKASNRPAAAVESCRNEIVQGFKLMAFGWKAAGVQRLKEIDGV